MPPDATCRARTRIPRRRSRTRARATTVRRRPRCAASARIRAAAARSTDSCERSAPSSSRDRVGQQVRDAVARRCRRTAPAGRGRLPTVRRCTPGPLGELAAEPEPDRRVVVAAREHDGDPGLGERRERLVEQRAPRPSAGPRGRRRRPRPARRRPRARPRRLTSQARNSRWCSSSDAPCSDRPRCQSEVCSSRSCAGSVGHVRSMERVADNSGTAQRRDSRHPTRRAVLLPHDCDTDHSQRRRTSVAFTSI